MKTNTTLTNAIRLALIAGTASATLPVTNAIAADGVDKVERIAVTGSRIKRTDMESASPISSIDSSTILASGATSIDDILQNMTAAGGAMTNSGINNGSGGNSRINLRGLGSNRTLVLVNGRRMIASGTGAASTVDLNTIPVSMIQRVDILKDGASAIYGTDAIAGVVNVILKRDFDGLELNAQTGISGQGDADETSLDLTLGNTFDKGNIVLNAQYTKRGDASQADRDFSDCPISESKDGLYCGGSSYSQGGHVWGNKNHEITKSGKDKDGKPIYAVGDSGFYGKYVADKDGNPVFEYHDDAKKQADVSGRGGEYHDFVNTGENNDKYNYAKDSYLSTPMERLNLTFAGTYEVSDTTMFFAEAMYTKRWSTQQMAPQPIWSKSDWVYDPISAGGWMTDDLVDFVQPGEAVSYGRRMVESGTRDFSQTVDTVRLVVGLEGEFDNDWTWDASYNKGKNDSVDTLANLHNIGAIDEAVKNKTFDPFLQSSWQGESIAPFIYTELNSGGSELDIASANLAGELFELPAGVVGFASGVEYRKESAHYTPDSLTAQGLANDPRVEPTAGSFSVKEAYVELAIPLLSDMPLAEHVEISTAMRFFDYNTFGSDNTWKLGLTWRVNESLMFRGVSSTAFRAPTVSELFGGESPSFDQVVHPATEQSQAQVTVGGNPLLTPEEADTITAGVVFEPSFVDGLSFTLDYYKVDITNTITKVDSNYIANKCLSASGTQINTDTALCQSADIKLDSTGRITFNNGLQNIGASSTSGFDFNAAYNFEALGLDWNANLDTSILTEFEELDPDGNAVDYRGFVTGGVGAYAKLKTNLNLKVSGDDWSATYAARYIDGMDSFACKDDPSKCIAPTVDSVIYHDLLGSLAITNDLTISGGIKNMFDKTPPYYSGNNDSNTDPFTYDVIGRYFFVRANVKF
ncbi:TonB-dependent receptor [Parashewanella spongiae]|uniref:TonB-dependent receptor n=1 Tax=Parashewanella spongiae TaxID=342950 RepID=A0A3A6TVB9_9GAMM|nr:TonB-dependent receptor [Parashewanella spongiae]MCL1077970.1 TonB-dependent receptor [Parashewanella spongiae]RJY16905.1 TonB-dependent receptor [Parashewanella spongiae]